MEITTQGVDAPYYVKMWATIRYQAEGWHRWVDAPPQLEYLSSLHRHIFHIEVKVSVKHEDREIEYHQLRQFCVDLFPPGRDHLGASCETMALRIIRELKSRYGERDYVVKVFEDGENGAEVSYEPALTNRIS